PRKLICASLCTAAKTMSCSLPSRADAVFPPALRAFRLHRSAILFAARRSLSQLKAAKFKNWVQVGGSTSQENKTTGGPGSTKSNLLPRMSLSSLNEDG